MERDEALRSEASPQEEKFERYMRRIADEATRCMSRPAQDRIHAAWTEMRQAGIRDEAAYEKAADEVGWGEEVAPLLVGDFYRQQQQPELNPDAADAAAYYLHEWAETTQEALEYMIEKPDGSPADWTPLEAEAAVQAVAAGVSAAKCEIEMTPDGLELTGAARERVSLAARRVVSLYARSRSVYSIRSRPALHPFRAARRVRVVRRRRTIRCGCSPGDDPPEPDLDRPALLGGVT